MDADEGKRHRISKPLAVLVLGLIGGFLATCIGGAIIGSMMMAEGQRPVAEELRSKPSIILISLAGLQLVMLAAVRYLPGTLDDLDGQDWMARVRWRTESFSPLNVICIALGTQFAGSLALRIFPLPPADEDTLQNLAKVANTSDDATLAMLLLLGAVLPGIVEELSFRGLLQPRLVERFGPGWGIIATSLLFALWHFDLRQGFAAFSMGLWLGWCAWRENSMVNVAFGHMANNCVFFIARHFVEMKTPTFKLEVVALQLGLLGVCVAAMHWRTRKVET